MTKNFFSTAFIYCLFVIYGSLVPLDFHVIPLDDAINQFKHSRWLSLNMESRADWVANILLYIPLAFFCAGSFDSFAHPISRGFARLLVPCFCLTLAIVIEFTQLFFPPRTVSINDLIAETLGIGLGLIIWHGLGKYFIELYQRISLGGLLSINAAIIFYLLIYLALSCFPFDFVTSQTELELKLTSSSDAMIMAWDVCEQDLIRCGVKLLIEMLVLLPLGMLWAMQPYQSHKVLSAALMGLLLGLIIEILQLLLVSGVAQGISVVTRIIGMSVGALSWQFLSKRQLDDWSILLRPLLLLLIPFYISLLGIINGFSRGAWLGIEQAITKSAETHFLPLYYFYYTSETQALLSLLGNIGAYLPIGLAYWAWSLTSPKAKKSHWLFVGLTAAGLAAIIETGKLFLAEKHPDPSDILIAFAAAAASYLFMNYFGQWVRDNKLTVETQPPLLLKGVRKQPSVQAIANNIDRRYRGFTLILFALVVSALWKYPLGSIWLAGFLCAYFYLLMRFPAAWLIAIPALLPIMDFAPWTGRFFFDEFDLLVLTTVAANYWHSPKTFETALFTKATRIVIGAFILVYALSLLRGLLPLQPIDTNAFASYYSNYNSLRLAKGVLWALLLLPLLKNMAYVQAKSYFTVGVLIALSGVIVIAIVERILFPGLLDFSSDYRITAMFSSMHTGGGHIDAFLALSLPFIALLLIDSALIANISGGVLFISGFYVLLVTFSRGTYLALAVSLLVLVIGTWINVKRMLDGKLILPLMLLTFVPIIAMPVVQGNLLQQRLSTISKDIQTRITHWQKTLKMRDNSIATELLGMGLGSYPRTYLWLPMVDKPLATFKIETEQNNNYLRFYPGKSLYLGQIIHLAPQTSYLLTADLRSDFDSVSVNIPICEKSLLYSFRCIDNVLTKKSLPGRWEHLELPLDSRTMAVEGHLNLRPIQLALTNGDKMRAIDIDNVKLLDASGNNLLINGDFGQGTDFWFFTTDDHQAGNIDNLWVQLLFEQGWLGIVTFIFLMDKTLIKLCKELSYDNVNTVLLSALAGFFIVGLSASPFDAPRVTMLFFLMVFIALREQPDKRIVHHKQA